MASRFVSNLSEIRRRARQHVLEGAVTSGYQADREKVIALLNEALATELVCVLRYKQHHFLARGIQAEPVAQEFKQHAAEEQEHADRIAQRIKQRSEGVLDFKEGTLYPALHKLENEGSVESYEGVEKGRPRRYYRITKSGRAALAKDRAEWRDLSRAVTMILGEA